MKFDPAIAYKILCAKQARLFDEISELTYRRFLHEHSGKSWRDPEYVKLQDDARALYAEAHGMHDVLNYLVQRMIEDGEEES